MSRRRRVLARWVLAGPAGLLLVAAAGRLTHDSAEPTVWDERVGRMVTLPGLTHRHRSEGWAETRIGRHGVAAIEDLSRIRGEKVVLWGDSHVEGYQVDDEEKMAQRLTRLWRERHGGHLTGFAVHGTNICELYWYAPAYEALAGDVRLHVLVIHHFDVLSPDDGRRDGCKLFGWPEVKFVFDPPRRERRWYHVPWVRDLVRGTGLDASLYLAAEAQKWQWRLRPGVASARRPPEPATEPDRYWVGSWDAVLAQLRRRVRTPLAIVYVPSIPWLERGLLRRDDPLAAYSRALAAACGRQGVLYADLGPAALALFAERGVFARGFFNTRPDLGHLNRHGHDLVARVVLRLAETAR